MSGILWLIAAAFVAAGVLAYTGVWKGWIRTVRGYGTYMGFCLLYVGIALFAAAAAVTVTVTTPWGTMLLVLAGALMLVAIVGFWWLPSFLQPEWFRRLRGEATGGGRR